MRNHDMESEEKLRHLATSIVTTIQSSPDVLANQTVDVPGLNTAEFIASDDAGIASPPKAYQFLQHLSSQAQSQSMQELIRQLVDVEDYLIWGHAPGYNKDNVGQEFLDNYCHALLSGPDGPLRCDSPLGAFVLFGPETLYRDHSHTPNEVYLALNAGGEWRVGSHDWTKLDEGQTIFIPSNAVHAIRTGAEPLLTFSFWLESADLNSIII